jgi:hypothetical protein
MTSEISEIKNLLKEFGSDLRKTTESVGGINVSLESIRGDIRVIRAERPDREEISQVIRVALENCAGKHARKDSSERIPRAQMQSPPNVDLILKIALGAIGLTGVALALLKGFLS